MTQPMRILSLTAENIKKLTVVHIAPDGNMVQITGKNGQGKTSVLDAIWWALAGADHIQSKPIREGADKARITLELGGENVELLVERRFTEVDSYLEVKTVDGAKYPSPQKMLNDLIGALAFDPLAFMRLDRKAQHEQLRELLGLDFTELDQADKKDFDDRTEINREIKSSTARLESIQVPEDIPAEPIDVDALQAELTQRNEHNQNRRRLQSDLEASAGAEREIVSNIEHLEQRLAEFREKLVSTKQETQAAQARLDAAPEQSTDEIMERISKAIQVNQFVKDRQERDNLVKVIGDMETLAAGLTDQLNERKKERTEQIANADMPLEGLSLEGEMVTFGGIPLDQASDAQQLQISTAVAAALNPKLRVIRIRDGSLLDDDSLAQLEAFAAEKDFQVWIERVDSSGEVGIVMVDGHVKGHPPPEPEEVEEKPADEAKPAQPDLLAGDGVEKTPAKAASAPIATTAYIDPATGQKYGSIAELQAAQAEPDDGPKGAPERNLARDTKTGDLVDTETGEILEDGNE